MASVYCIYPAYAVDPVPIKTECKVLALHSHLKQQLFDGGNVGNTFANKAAGSG